MSSSISDLDGDSENENASDKDSSGGSESDSDASKDRLLSRKGKKGEVSSMVTITDRSAADGDLLVST